MIKTFEIRFRQFARGRRSIKTITIRANCPERAKRIFENTICFAKVFNYIPLQHAQFISVFPAKEA